MQVYGNGMVFRPAPIGRNEDVKAGQVASKPLATQQGQSFEQILHGKIEDNERLQFSKHAEMRLANREITLSSDQLNRIEEGVSKAKEKGIKDSLVLVDNLAFVVNTGNNVVITAMAQDQEKENVFTKIDGAVIV